MNRDRHMALRACTHYGISTAGRMAGKDEGAGHIFRRLSILKVIEICPGVNHPHALIEGPLASLIPYAAER